MKKPVSFLATASSEGQLTPRRDRHSDPMLNGALAEERSRRNILNHHPRHCQIVSAPFCQLCFTSRGARETAFASIAHLHNRRHTVNGLLGLDDA